MSRQRSLKVPPAKFKYVNFDLKMWSQNLPRDRDRILWLFHTGGFKADRKKTDQGKSEMKELVRHPLPTLNCYQPEDFTALGRHPKAERERKSIYNEQRSPFTPNICKEDVEITLWFMINIKTGTRRQSPSL